MTGQLAFDLPPATEFGRDAFFVSAANAVALATVEGWRDWPLGKLLLLGPPGAGKTHLAHIWAQMADAVILPARDLVRADLPGLATRGAVVVEDAEALAGDRGAEEALFHLHNMLSADGRLMVTAQGPSRDWGLTLPDLKSRMDAAHVARLAAPDDALLQAVLGKLFADRQVIVAPTLIPWMVVRMERSISAARRLVAELDARALAVGRPISRSMAAALLDSDDAE